MLCDIVYCMIVCFIYHLGLGHSTRNMGGQTETQTLQTLDQIGRFSKNPSMCGFVVSIARNTAMCGSLNYG